MIHFHGTTPLLASASAFALAVLSGCGDNEPSGGWETGTPAAAELTALNQTLTDAYEREDVALLQQLLAGDHVHNNVFGMALTKDAFLADIESGVLEFLSYETPEIRWHIDGNTAIATGVIEAKAVRAGKPVPAERFLFTRIFVKEQGEWKVLLFHNTMEGRPPGVE